MNSIAQGEPVAWLCTDDRHPFVKGLVTDRKVTADAWKHSGIDFVGLYPLSGQMTAGICCYCDAPISCAACGREQPGDSSATSPGATDREKKLLAEKIQDKKDLYDYCVRAETAEDEVKLLRDRVESARASAIEECAKIAENNGWEATAAQIRDLALPTAKDVRDFLSVSSEDRT